MSYPHISYTDNRQNPHSPDSREYDIWQNREMDRLRQLSSYREGIRRLSEKYLTDKEPEIRSMAHFIKDMLK